MPNTDKTTFEDFGAVGDGVADDTDALQAAVDAGVGEGRGGTYRVTRTILVPPSVTVRDVRIILREFV